MRLMIIGQKWLGAALLEHCLADGRSVVAVSVPTQTDRLATRAAAHGVPVHVHTRRFGADAVPDGCDLLLAAHAHACIDADARSKARLGALGYHPSLLPRHRGRDAIRWTLHMRDPIAGGTLYWLDDGADTGPIALQDWCHVRPADTPATLWQRELAPLGLRLFRQALTLLDTGRLPALEQDTHVATWEPAFTPRPFTLSG